VKERFGFGPEHLTDYKGLRGDTSDNIIGIKGIGEKTAEELIVNFGSIEDIYKKLKKDEEAFLKAGIKKRIIQLLKDGEEEALFSKTLATIRRDAPIHFVVPEKVWREDVDMKKVQELFVEFEFRTLAGKFAEVLSIDMPEEISTSASPEEIREIGLLLWIVDSNKTTPTLEDILSYTRANNISDARKYLEKMIKDQELSFVVDSIEMPLLVLRYVLLALLNVIDGKLLN
jgi:DNA polymerase-1